jgi:hypothetical protein
MVRPLTSRVKGNLLLQLAWLLVLVMFACPTCCWATIDLLAPTSTESESESDSDSEESSKCEESKISSVARYSARQSHQLVRKQICRSGSQDCITAPRREDSRLSVRSQSLLGSGIRQLC